MTQPRHVIFTLAALDMSGAAFSSLNLAAGLLQRGLRPIILSREGGERLGGMQALGLKVLLARYFGVPLLGRNVARVVKTFTPEIIHAQSMQILGPSWSLAKKLNIPLVVTANRIEDTYPPELARHHEIGVIAVSNAIQERLTNTAGIDRDRIRVIPNGLNLAQFPCRPLDTPPEKVQLPVVGSYGTLAERKGQRVFLRAAAEVLHSGVDAEFLIMGHGPDKPALRALAAELGISNRVTFTPSTSSDAGNFTSIDLLVEPTYQEGLGLSVLQAMATGVPVVASGVGGLFSLVKDGETGALVPSGDEHALAAAIKQLLANPEQRREMARQARDRVEKEFNAERVARRTMEYYAERITAGESHG